MSASAFFSVLNSDTGMLIVYFIFSVDVHVSSKRRSRKVSRGTGLAICYFQSLGPKIVIHLITTHVCDGSIVLKPWAVQVETSGVPSEFVVYTKQSLANVTIVNQTFPTLVFPNATNIPESAVCCRKSINQETSGGDSSA
jgi:hypothetical protein